MSSYLVIAKVSEALRQILWEEFEADPDIRRYVPSREDIVFKNPTEAAQNSAHRLSLWLFNIRENEFLRNQPAQRANGKRPGQGAGAPGDGSKKLRFPPLPLNLQYLLTPITPGGEADLMLMGKTLQVLYDNPVVLLQDDEDEVHEELRINLTYQTVNEMARIWEALKDPYRLSVSYEVRVTRIDSDRVVGSARVISRFDDNRTIPAGAGSGG